MVFDPGKAMEQQLKPAPMTPSEALENATALLAAARDLIQRQQGENLLLRHQQLEFYSALCEVRASRFAFFFLPKWVALQVTRLTGLR